ncbi:MAG: thymidine phosphorylase [Candidatus Marinimicrobia bacterium]|nr:thymidine phosphorylase [Candidatus Neomarinimicrobiota bacterium]|tara:strand:+ start:1506 stop:2786 length:1281 start_codon:yes stop_codon:yes gene_type:complete
MFNPYLFIDDKKNGIPHNKEDIKTFINKFLTKEIESSQMAAWLMAVCFNGMNDLELNEYVNVIIDSGERLDFSYLDGFIIDKHSTGGVGDKVSLIAGPILASCNCYVPMVVGRSLAHTGGTLDKLESIIGYNGNIDINQFKRNVKTNGISIIGQNKYICPADKYIYSIRDITSTIKSMPLICASILSKKKAEGIEGLVLDIKTGNGAFMQTLKNAKNLGDSLKKLSQELQIKTEYIITDMNQPLGTKSGLWCEIEESIEFLKNQKREPLLNEVVFKICSTALKISGQLETENLIENAITSGDAYERFEKMIRSHNGDLQKSYKKNLPKNRFTLKSKKEGYITKIETEKLGYILLEIGGGRKKSNDTIDPSCGISIYKKLGDKISINEPILEIFCSNSTKLDGISKIIEKIFHIDKEVGKKPLIIYN